MSHKFPYQQEFTDCAGIKRTFLITSKDLGETKYFKAIEQVDDGYEFGSINTSTPHGLGELIQKVKKGISIKYLSLEKSSEPSLDFFEAKGRLSCDGVVIDGKLLTYKEFSKIMSTHSGFDFTLKIKDQSDN